MSERRAPIPRHLLESVLGRWGMEELVEPRVRELVHAHLGIAADAVEPLAWPPDTHALDILALATLVEGALSIDLPERLLDRVDSYRALVDVIVGRLVALGDASREPVAATVQISAVVQSAAGAGSGMVRAGLLTAYLAQTIMDDAHLSQRGAHLDVCVADDATADDVVTVRRHFARLVARGTTLAVRRDSEEPPTDQAPCHAMQ